MTDLDWRVGDGSVVLPSPRRGDDDSQLGAVPRVRAVPRGPDWVRTLVRNLVIGDVACALLAVAIGYLARVGLTDPPMYATTSALVTAMWISILAIQGSYEARGIATGAPEYQRVIRAGTMLAGSIAIVCYLIHSLLGRTFIAIVIPAGIVLMVGNRLVVRGAVYRRRRRGQWSRTILAIGTIESVQHLAGVARRRPEAGLVVVGACVDNGEIGAEIAPGVRVLGPVPLAAHCAEQLDVDVVAVAGNLGPRRVRELGWALEGTRRNMVMAPELTEVAGPRVHVTPVEGLPLMWVDQPQFTGARRLVKRAVDVIVSAAALIAAAPLLLLIALAVRLTSAGPVIYRSKRLGQDGGEITVLKFRTMVRDAHATRNMLIDLNEGAGVLFKIRDDPRLTKFGRLLRQFSFDELPQLFNVLAGSMSLVGPRPPLPEEAQRYAGDVRRRLLVKPGLTGLWQVSGRSDLSWKESVRLDLYYVENWSLGFDFAIIARTVMAVLRRRGAY